MALPITFQIGSKNSGAVLKARKTNKSELELSSLREFQHSGSLFMDQYSFFIVSFLEKTFSSASYFATNYLRSPWSLICSHEKD
jgi:hypothetical protein